MGRMSNQQKLRRAIEDLGELVGGVPGVEITYSIHFPNKPEEKPKPKIFEEDGCCKVHKDAWVDAGNSCPFCDGTQDYKDF